VLIKAWVCNFVPNWGTLSVSWVPRPHPQDAGRGGARSVCHLFVTAVSSTKPALANFILEL
jgi:hypothetical protein